jgi:hypothetical protein
MEHACNVLAECGGTYGQSEYSIQCTSRMYKMLETTFLGLVVDPPTWCLRRLPHWSDSLLEELVLVLVVLALPCNGFSCWG